MGDSSKAHIPEACKQLCVSGGGRVGGQNGQHSPDKHEACARQLFYCESTVPAGESLHGYVAVCNNIPGALAEE